MKNREGFVTVDVVFAMLILLLTCIVFVKTMENIKVIQNKTEEKMQFIYYCNAICEDEIHNIEYYRNSDENLPLNIEGEFCGCSYSINRRVFLDKFGAVESIIKISKGDLTSERKTYSITDSKTRSELKFYNGSDSKNR